MKISEIITDKYKLRIPPTVYYDLLADVQEVEEEQEPILDKIRAEIKAVSHGKWYVGRTDGKAEEVLLMADVLQILDKYKADRSEEE